MHKNRLPLPYLLAAAALILSLLAVHTLLSSQSRVTGSARHGSSSARQAEMGLGGNATVARTGRCRLHILYYDSLARDYPNTTLVREIEAIAHRYNACLTLVLGREAGVKPILELGRYDIVVIRAHGGIWPGHGYYIATGLTPDGRLDIPPELAERLASSGVLAEASPAVFIGGGVEGAEKLVIVGSVKLFDFVKPKNGSVLIMMTCSSLQDPAFVSRALSSGSSLYIGWLGTVTPQDIDAVLPRILIVVLEAYTRGARGCEILKAVTALGPLLIARDTHSVLSASCVK